MRKPTMTFRIPVELKETINDPYFQIQFGKPMLLFKQALIELINQDQPKITAYLKANTMFMEFSDHPKMKSFSMDLNYDLKQNLTKLRQNDAIMAQIISVSNYLRHVCAYYINQFEQKQTKQTLTQNPIAQDDQLKYQAVVTYDPQKLYYQIFVPGIEVLPQFKINEQKLIKTKLKTLRNKIIQKLKQNNTQLDQALIHQFNYPIDNQTKIVDLLITPHDLSDQPTVPQKDVILTLDADLIDYARNQRIDLNQVLTDYLLHAKHTH